MSRQFGDNVRRYREQRDMSQDGLARQMAERGWPWHQSTTYKIEKGERRTDAFEVRDLAEILGVTVDRLFWPGEEAAEIGLVDRAIAMIREAWHETSDATVRLQASLAAGKRVAESAEKSKYARVRQVAAELRTEIENSSAESAAGDGLARYEHPEG